MKLLLAPATVALAFAIAGCEPGDEVPSEDPPTPQTEQEAERPGDEHVPVDRRGQRLA